MNQNKTHWKQNFDYRYTGAYELAPGEEKMLTIKNIYKDEVQDTTGSKKMCLICSFVEAPKPMVLNKTNCKTLEKLYSPFQEDWIGKKIIVAAAKVKAFGEFVEALRIKNTVPQDNKIDVTDVVTAINDCTSLDELQTLYMSFTPQIKALTIKQKDAKKASLQ